MLNQFDLQFSESSDDQSTASLVSSDPPKESVLTAQETRENARFLLPVASITMKGTAANRKAFQLLQDTFPTIDCHVCVAHSMDLIFKEFAKKIKWINMLTNDTVEVANVFEKQSLPREMLKMLCPRTNVNFPATRFRYMPLTLERLSDCKEALVEIVKVIF